MLFCGQKLQREKVRVKRNVWKEMQNDKLQLNDDILKWKGKRQHGRV